ncbi:MAG: FRG domain-containing protein [Candidatus Poribacteria bacterium]|nr:FRG domain-containing protein [Candidatus Poribacteria bacterium]
MNKPIEISNLEDYIGQIVDVIQLDKNYLYRGQENKDWQVNSSAYRRLNDQYGRNYRSDVLYRLWQRYLLQIIDEIELKYPSAYRGLKPLECMAHLQHNKVATGLIDFTFNPLVGLWFACDGKDNKDVDGKVIVIENNGEKIEEIKTVESIKRNLDEFFNMN